MIRHLLLLFASLSLSACAVGPLVVHETARTVGDNNHEIDGGYGQAGLVVKYTYGVTENFDLGVHLESLSVGVRGKYAFINSPDGGWSLAAAGGLGSSVGGNHYYADLMTSYMAGSWEPYGVLRFVRVKTDPVEFKDEDTGTFDFKVDSAEYSYGQFTLGGRYWFNPHWMLSIEASTLYTLNGLSGSNIILVGAAFGYRF